MGRLGILWRDGKHHPINDLKQNWVRFVALPNPKLAPYGVAAQQALEHMGLWEFVRQKVVYGENVRQTLQLFESGNADAVLTADSLLQGKDPTLMPADWHKPIIQKAGIVASTKNLEAARKFLEFLTSPAGQAIFAKFGFSGPGSALLSFRVRPVVNRLQVLERDLRVFLSGRKPRVPQQLLNRPQIGPIAQQVGRVSVPEAVRVNGRIARHQQRIQLHQPPHLPVP